MKINLQNISFNYKQFGQSSNNGQSVLKNISLLLDHYQIIGIVGPSGSGKTTLIQMLNGLLEPNAGKVVIDDQPVSYKGDYANFWRKRVCIVFQFPEMQFFENKVFDEIAYALRNQQIDENEIAKRINNVAALLEFNQDDFLLRSPFHLSEGQKRKVAIASILVLEPEILILDEPTAGLDYKGIQILKRIVKKIYQQDRTVIIVSHDMDFVAELAQRVIVLSKGEINYDGSKENFFQQEKLLSDSHLELPQIMQTVKKLRRNGIDIKYPIYSVEELKDYLSKLS
jgi:energy-coupling factor transport system ATP-binding protein